MKSGKPSRITRIAGPAVGLRGDDIDTDRIIPARFLKTITFDGLEDHLFEDDRKQLAEQGRVHPLDRPEHAGARLLFVESNFGCGSSREHAPQAIARRGFGAVVGVSFAEIFYGNALMIGLPCATVTAEQAAELIALAEARPELEFVLDVEARTIAAADRAVPVTMPDATRSALLSGNWDATALLLDDYDRVDTVAAGLPYVGWSERRA